MTCEQAIFLISSQLDGEIDAADRALLECHVADCEECRATADAFELQHRELTDTFEPRRAAAVLVADRVNARLPGDTAGRPASKKRLPLYLFRGAALVAAAAAVLGPVIVVLALMPARPQATVQPQDRTAHVSDDDKLLPRARAATPPAKTLAVGEVVRTEAGQRERFNLADGSILYVNQNTSLHLEAERTVKLDDGEVFIEVAPRTPEQTGATFTVQAPDRTFKALGTKFAVRAAAGGSELVVSQGKVKAEGGGAESLIGNGIVWREKEHQAFDKEKKVVAVAVEPAERITHVLDWTRDLMADAETALVPTSRYDGGALIAVDANGQEAKLSLRKYHIDVHIEDGFARTTIDQTYFNHHPSRLEGTFYFPLPPDASLSRLAMYVDGKLMEGGMAERQYAAQVYQRIVSSQRDPALLEWVDGTTFKMRVFPLEGRQEKRIVLSYSQRIPTLYGRAQYRFPAGHSLQVVNDWSFNAVVKDGAQGKATSPTNPRMKVAPQGNDLVLTDEAKAVKIDRDVVLDLTDATAAEPVRYSRADHDGQSYLMFRYRPELHTQAKAQRRDWIFLYETSADRNPLLARVQIEIIRTLLDNAEHEDTFRVLAVGTTIHPFADDAKPATPANVKAAVDFLEHTHLIGALDLGHGFAATADAAKGAKNPYLVHVGSGITHMGVMQNDLLDHLPKGARYVGVGVGKNYDRRFMKQAAEQTGGYYTQINPDEPITWRAFDLLATLNTPRLLDVHVVDKAAAKDEGPRFLVDNPSVAQGEELCAIARLERDVPQTLLVTGLLDGQPYREEVAVANVAGHADYLPRTWAKLEIDRLLGNSIDNQPKIIELSKAMYVMTPFTSLLVLENEEMYKEFKVDRGRKDHWALYACPDKIPVVYEPDPTQPVDVRNAPKNVKPAANQVLQTVLVRVPARWLDRGNDRSQQRGSVVTAVELYTGAYAMPVEGLGFARLGEEGRQEHFFAEPRLSKIPYLETHGREKAEVRERLRVFHKSMAVDNTPDETLSLMDAFVSPTTSWTPSYNPFGRVTDYRQINPTTGLEVAARSLRGADGTMAWDLGRPMTKASLNNNEYSFGMHLPQSLDYNGAFDSFDPKDRNDFAYRSGSEAFTSRIVKLRRANESDNDTVVLGGPINKNRTGEYFGMGDLMDGESRRLDQLFEVPQAVEFAETRLLAKFKKRVGFASNPEARTTGAVLYERIVFSNDARLFTDLPAYAPGLNTSVADVQAVLETEAAPELRNTPGHIDPAARKLIDEARKGGWRKFVLDAAKNPAGESFAFDGAGRFVYEQTLPLGLHETVVCDGVNLLHLYPELGLGATRPLSRFHRAEWLSATPWLLPPAEDLAHGADLELVDEHTVALVPHVVKNLKAVEGKTPEYVRVQLVFAGDRLAERQLVAVGKEVKLLAREIYDGEGSISVRDAKGNDLGGVTQPLTATPAPNLHPDTKELVVLPLPFRSRQNVMDNNGLNSQHPLGDVENGCYTDLPADAALQLLGALYAQGATNDARLLVRDRFFAKEDRRVGLFTMLLACGVEPGANAELFDVLQTQTHQPVGRYVLLHGNQPYQVIQRRWPLNSAKIVGDPASFLRRLAEFYDLTLRDPALAPIGLERTAFDADLKSAGDFIKRNESNVLGWALLTFEQDHRSPRTSGLHKQRWAWFAGQWERIAKALGNDHNARYERAQCLWNASQPQEARQLFGEVYAQDLAAGLLPAIDHRFRSTLESGEQDAWNPLIRETAAKFMKQDRRGAVVALATQCQQLGDRPLADNLLALALTDLGKADDALRAEFEALKEYQALTPAQQTAVLDDAMRGRRLRVTLLAVAYYRRLGDHARAGELLDGLLTDDPFKRIAGLWRLASTVADERGDADKAVRCLEVALELEYRDLPDVIDLQTWRRDYGRLLNHYRTVVNAAITQHQPPPGDIPNRTIRAADHWRKHDPEAAEACRTASDILKLLGAREIAWEYLTTSEAARPTTARTWIDLGHRLQNQGDFVTADRAYTTAFEADAANPSILWDRAQNKRQLGDAAGCNQLLRQVRDGKWGTEYNHVRANARWQLEGR